MDSTRPFITTGIAGLDRALGDKLRPGNLIGVIGCTGAGKTILSTQIARHAITSADPRQTSLILTDTSPEEVWDRFLSAEFGIDYSETLGETEKILRIRDREPLPHPSHFGQEAVIHAEEMQFARLKWLNVTELSPHSLHEEGVLETSLSKFETDLPDAGGIVILDFLESPPGLDGEREEMKRIAALLRQFADRGRILVFAFAQAQGESTGKRYLEPGDTGYARDLFADADAFIGIGQELGDDNPSDPSRGVSSIYRKKQTLSVFLSGKREPIRVPVTHRFEYQRFEDREADEQKVGDYLPFTRKRFRELCTIGLPTCINLYAFLAIKARYHGKLSGSSWHSRLGISEKTGLTEKQLRTATKHLESKGFIQTKRRGSGTLLYAIQDWHEHHTADLAGNMKDGYVRIYRSVAERDWLFGNPNTLRLWLYILANAQVYTNSRHLDLTRGRLKFDPDEIEHEIGMNEDHTREALQALQDFKSAQIIQVDRVGEVICVVNWDRYQVDV